MPETNGEIAGLDYQRVVDAQVVKEFSDTNGRLVELVRNEGDEFVRRTYLPDSVSEIEQSSGVGFSETWQVYTEMFGSVGLSLVESRLFEESLDGNPVIVTRFLGYLGSEADIEKLPIERKVDVVGRLGKLLTAHKDFLPNAQGFMADGLVIDLTTEDQEVVVVDVDPYVNFRGTGRFGGAHTASVQSAFMMRSGWNIDRWASDDEERSAMATAFCRTAGEVLDDHTREAVLKSFTYVHFMSNGFGPEELRALGY